MKAKNQPPITSETEAKEKLIVYVYEYLLHVGAKRAADEFIHAINYDKAIQILEAPGFLVNWWCVFWDLYCAAPGKRTQVEPSNEARAFHEYHMRSVMSPSCTQTSPPQQGPPFMGGQGMTQGPRYGPHTNQMRGGSPMNVGLRMQNMMQGGGPSLPQMSGPPHPLHPPMIGASSPRYAPHPGHMTPGSSASSGPMGEPGPSPGVNRMTPGHNGSPHPQVGPPNGMGPMGGPQGPPPGGSMGGPPPNQPMPQRVGPAGQSMQQGGGGPPQEWQGNFNVNSPAEQQCFMPGPPVSAGGQQGDFGGMMMNDGGMMEMKPTGNTSGQPNQQQEEYVIPNTYGQQTDQGEAGQEILKLKESLENNTKGYNDADQSGFNMDFNESQNKW